MGKPKKIIVVCAGTRGDCQPYIAISLALQRGGYDVAVISCTNHKDFVQSFGLQFFGAFIDAEAIMKTEEKIKRAMTEGDTFAFLDGLTAVFKKYTESHVTGFHEAITEFVPDLCLTGTLMELFGAWASFRLNIPSFPVMLQQVAPNPKPMVFGMPDLPLGLNKMLVKFIFRSQYNNGTQFMDSAIQEKFGYKVCDAYTFDMYFEDITYPTTTMPKLVCQSEHFRNVFYPNAPPTLKYCGACVVTAEDQIRATQNGGNFGDDSSMKALRDFIAAGTKPAYMGWGSMICKSPEFMCELVVKAAMLSGARVIVLGGWAKLNLDVLQRATKDESLLIYAKKNMLFVENSPHEWLFPQCTCIVHHGGAGTTCASLRAGVPTVITPVFVDQFDHAYFVNKMGVGVGYLKQFQKITAEEIAGAMTKCMNSSEIVTKAKEMGEQMRAAPGTLAVVEAVEKFWTTQVETGAFEKFVKERKQRSPKTWWACCGSICS